ncbi:MAG TPA: hypothetical protein VGZ47_14610 [Gemmataceae bacterium]|jgi:hypothetical protein|nr:hypothetical protein [Gemmataceae bacterium]
MANPVQVSAVCINLSSKFPSHIVLIDPDARLGAFDPASVQDAENNLHWKPEKWWTNAKGTRMVIRIRRMDKEHPVSLQPATDPPDSGSASVTLSGGTPPPVVSPVQATYTSDDGGM